MCDGAGGSRGWSQAIFVVLDVDENAKSGIVVRDDLRGARRFRGWVRPVVEVRRSVG